MRFFNSRTSVRIVVAAVAGVVFAVTGFRGSAGDAAHADPTPASDGTAVVEQVTPDKPANWPWG